MRRGFDFDLLEPICLPFTPGQDIVGHVVQIGYKVDSIKLGERVAALVRHGGNARYISVPCTSLVKVPRKIDSAEAVAMVSTYMAAYQVLKEICHASESFTLSGKHVLVIGGMDAVAQALIQMCLKAGAIVFATAPNRRHAYMRQVLGAHPLPEHVKEWLPLTFHQMDYVFDGLCEDGLETSWKALNDHGEIVCFGHSAMLKENQKCLLGAPLAAHINKLWSTTKPRAKIVDLWQTFQRNPESYKVS